MCVSPVGQSMVGRLTRFSCQCTNEHFQGALLDRRRDNRPMPYLVLQGTPCRVITPKGRVIDPYTCRHYSAFTDAQMKAHGLQLHFNRRGFTLIVRRDEAIPFSLSCTDC